MIYDLIIIGGGPAGASAAVYASRKRLKTLLLTSEWGGQSIVSETIYNWIGTTAISGNDLAKNLKGHVLANSVQSENKIEADKSTLEAKDDEKVSNINKINTSEDGDIFEVETEKGDKFKTKTVLISAGSGRRKLNAKGADTLEHKGLTYCASCDGPLFSDMDVIVAGGGNAGFETAAQLLAYCKSVTLLHRSDTFKADQITVEKVSKNPKFKAIVNVDILEIKGDKFVEGVLYKDQKTGEEVTLPVSGVFVEIGQIPNTGFAKNVITLDDYGRIKIDPKTQKTETPGIWAAGDCTDVLYHQNNIAAGDAVRALEDIYLAIHTKY